MTDEAWERFVAAHSKVQELGVNFAPDQHYYCLMHPLNWESVKYYELRWNWFVRKFGEKQGARFYRRWTKSKRPGSEMVGKLPDGSFDLGGWADVTYRF